MAEAAAGHRRTRIARARRSCAFSRTTIRSPTPAAAFACINWPTARAGARWCRCCCSGRPVPMLFQGQECATTSPFTYFADQEGDLAEAVRKGRLEFLSQFPSLTDPETRRHAAGSADETTFRACKINWCGHPGVGGGQATAHGSVGAATIRRRAGDARHAGHAGGDVGADARLWCCCDTRRTPTSG